MKASTLPDNMEKAATICEGIYEANHGAHKGYAAIILNNDQNIPAYNSKTGNDYANGIHFHMAGLVRNDDPEKPYSTGCITIPLKDYLEFGTQVGFINNEKAKDIREIWGNFKAAQYNDAKQKIDYGTYKEKFNGYIVIDRQYYNDTKGYLKFNGPRGVE